MKFLSVETSTKRCVVAILDERGFLCGAQVVFERGRSEALIHLIRRCLKKAKWGLEAVDGFGVGVGPGSFTGIRIGLSVVKGLSFATGKPCFAFSSLEAIATAGLDLSFERVGTLVDAKRDSFYWNSYERIARGGGVFLRRLTKKDRLLERRQAVRAVKRLLAGGQAAVFSGDGVSPLKDGSCFSGDNKISVLGEEYWYPTPESIARLTLEKFRAGEATDAQRLSAVYLFAHDCQVRPSRKKEEGV